MKEKQGEQNQTEIDGLRHGPFDAEATASRPASQPSSAENIAANGVVICPLSPR